VVHFVRQWTSTGYLKSYKGHHSTIGLMNTRTTLVKTPPQPLGQLFLTPSSQPVTRVLFVTLSLLSERHRNEEEKETSKVQTPSNKYAYPLPIKTITVGLITCQRCASALCDHHSKCYYRDLKGPHQSYN
jgi:hypothetical protein